MQEQRAPASFDDADTRRDGMHSTVDQWLEELIDATQEAKASDAFREWLDAQAQFHDYSYRNSLLIKQQCPEATKVAGYRTWQEEFDRHVREGESAIWIWAPIVTTRCPACHNSVSYHEDSDCEYDETPPEDWDEGIVAFRPVSVFDISQTDGDPLPELDTAATGDGTTFVEQLLDAAEELDLSARIVPESEWSYGTAKGVCQGRAEGAGPVVKIRERDSAAMAGTLCHEYAHAVLHMDGASETDRASRELEAEAVAYVVGRRLGLEMSGSAFYLAAWSGDEPETLRDRLGRISRTASTIISTL